jgi:signal transduction histidine kinase
MISKQGRKFIRITVDDSGIGILPEILERIFGKHPICSIPN